MNPRSTILCFQRKKNIHLWQKKQQETCSWWCQWSNGALVLVKLQAVKLSVYPSLYGSIWFNDRKTRAVSNIFTYHIIYSVLTTILEYFGYKKWYNKSEHICQTKKQNKCFATQCCRRHPPAHPWWLCSQYMDQSTPEVRHLSFSPPTPKPKGWGGNFHGPRSFSRNFKEMTQDLKRLMLSCLEKSFESVDS